MDKELKALQEQHREDQRKYNEENPPTEWEKKIYEIVGEKSSEDISVDDDESEILQKLDDRKNKFLINGKIYYKFYTWEDTVCVVPNGLEDLDFRDFSEEFQKELCRWVIENYK